MNLEIRLLKCFYKPFELFLVIAEFLFMRTVNFTEKKNLCLVMILFVFSFSTFGQNIFPLGTFQRMGINEVQTGNLLAYPESDSTVVIFIEVTKGAPSYNSGTIYSRVTRTETAILKLIDEYFDCELEMKIQYNSIVITTKKENCGFGHGVSADGTFELTNSEIPEFFENMEGTKIFFSETSPEEYNQ